MSESESGGLRSSVAGPFSYPGAPAGKATKADSTTIDRSR